MSFSTLIFLLLFLPLYLIFYMRSDSISGKNNVLLVFSLIFYAFGGLKYLLLLIIMAAAGWAFGLAIERANSKKKKQTLLVLSVVIFLAVLGIFKYTGFFVGTFGAIFHKDWAVSIALPIGISFYIFKLLSYTADVYSGKCKAETSYRIFLLYLSIFHQSLQGPIVRYSQMRDSLYKREMTMESLSAGLYRFSVGLAKKTILADQCGRIADSLIPMSRDISSVTTLGMWTGALVYSMQLYIDFSAYTDMAVGLGTMIGFTYPENFNYPYTAVSIRDFWRRWHITLSRFFRDYVYIPLGGNRVSAKRTILNLLAVWALTGFWHGASWNFILWGLYYFVFIVFENWRRQTGKKDWPPVLQHIYTIVVFVFGWVLFRFSDFHQLGYAIRAFFGFGGNGFTSFVVKLNVMNNLWLLIFCVLTCTPALKKAGEYIQHLSGARKLPVSALHILKTVIVVLLLIMSIFTMAGNTYQPFLYNQF